MTLTDNPFLAGNYGPVPDETTSFDLPVDGALPAELNGRYLRIGPNPYAPPQGEYHWFLGDGMVHGVELRAGKATWYRNRWVRTETISEARNEPATPGPKPPMYDASNTHVIGRGFARACGRGDFICFDTSRKDRIRFHQAIGKGRTDPANDR